MSRTQHLLDKAFFEAVRGQWLFTAPNPRVGAVALKNGHIVGCGHHAAFGGPHAEEAALRNVGAWDLEKDLAVPGVVDEMVVTLEPCSSTKGKKRPPCTTTLLQAGIKKVTVAALDPDPRHGGAGLEILKQAGIEVDDSGVEANQPRFEEQNPAFLSALTKPDLPWVLLKWASTVDGKIATSDGISKWISGPEARAEVHQLRALGDAVMVGSQTLRLDNPELTARPQGVAVRSQPLRICLLPSQAGFDDKSSAVMRAAGPRLWLIDQKSPLPRHDDHHIRVPRTENGLDLKAALIQLRQQYGIRRILVEGGARLHGSLLNAGLTAAMVRYEAPLLLGGNRPACDGPSFSSPQHAVHLSDEESLLLGVDQRRAFLICPAPTPEAN